MRTLKNGQTLANVLAVAMGTVAAPGHCELVLGEAAADSPGDPGRIPVSLALRFPSIKWTPSSYLPAFFGWGVLKAWTVSVPGTTKPV